MKDELKGESVNFHAPARWVERASSLRLVLDYLDGMARNGTRRGEALIGRLESYYWFSGGEHNEGPTGWGGSPSFSECKGPTPESGHTGVALKSPTIRRASLGGSRK